MKLTNTLCPDGKRMTSVDFLRYDFIVRDDNERGVCNGVAIVTT